jgi:hypothetical protein
MRQRRLLCRDCDINDVPPATTIASFIIDSCNIFSFSDFSSALSFSDMQFAPAEQPSATATSASDDGAASDATTSAATTLQLLQLLQRQQRSLECRCSSDDAAAVASVMAASAAALCAHQQLTTLATSCAIGGIVCDDSCSINGRDNVGAACIRYSRLNFGDSDNVSAARICRSCLSFSFSDKVSAACIRCGRLNFKRQRRRQVNSGPSTFHQVGIVANANISVCFIIEYITCYCYPPIAASHHHPVNDTNRSISPSGHSTPTVRL